MPLVGKIGESDITSQLPANDILHIRGGLSDGLRVLRADSLGITGPHWVAALHKRRASLAAGRGRLADRCNRGAIGRSRSGDRRWGC